MRKCPDYYRVADVEVGRIVEAANLPGRFRGEAIMYIFRAGKKPGATEEDDLRKARDMIDGAIEELTRQDVEWRGAP